MKTKINFYYRDASYNRVRTSIFLSNNLLSLMRSVGYVDHLIDEITPDFESALSALLTIEHSMYQLFLEKLDSLCEAPSFTAFFHDKIYSNLLKFYNV
ncbi:MAG: hypothetical protein QXE19_05500 [Candidatus Bathyarchaeia archaeon]